MNQFQVLSRDQEIQKNHFLEASAGTGKTFSIENIVVRLLLERDSLSIDQILVVTFTRAATRDLKVRIHRNVMNAIDALKGLPEVDYLVKIVEEGEESRNAALRKLERAICCFDTAQIYTIHGFCSQILSENTFQTHFIDEVKNLSEAQIRFLIRDFFRKGVLSKHLSKGQIRMLMQSFSGDLKKLEKGILNALSKGYEIIETPSFGDMVPQFNEAMKRLKINIRDLFYSLLPSYRGICDRQGNIKPDIFERVNAFAELFKKDYWDKNDLDWLIEDQLFFVTLFDPANLKAKASLPDDYQQVVQIKEELKTFVSVNQIFARVVYDCKKMLIEYKDREESFDYDDLLKKMRTALSDKAFVDQIRVKYQAAIIDEFQDTDPIQWEIFNTLFLPNTLLYLVGDPKQSIYAFRQADIYTYLEAAEAMGSDHHYSLDTNYRSHPPLIEALNTLFSEASEMLYLPKKKMILAYPPVKAPLESEEKNFSDGKGSVHFFIAEDKDSKKYPLKKLEKELFFPFIVDEIMHLHRDENVSFQQIAILVADRYQAERVSDYLSTFHIPVASQRSKSLVDSAALPAMRELLQSILNPKDESALKIALGGKIIRWTEEEIRELEQFEKLERVLYLVFSLNQILLKNGFAPFFQKLLSTHWNHSESLIQKLLHEQDGDQFFSEWQQVAELLLEEENNSRCTPEGLVKYLTDLLSENDDSLTEKQSDPTRNAVQVMTLHASKGLEFDIVFSLGLIKRTRLSEQLIPKDRMLIPVIDEESEEYQHFCEELDAEKMRQLYVAMTRAKYRLYNPVLFAPQAAQVDRGCSSPMELFLARLGQPPFKLTTFLDHHKDHSLSYSLLNKQLFRLEIYENVESVTLGEPPRVIIPGKERYIQSFTALSHLMGMSQSTFDELKPPYSFSCPQRTPHTLPAGSETGTLLHHCLENLSFDVCQEMKDSNELNPILLPYLQGTPYEEWVEVVCEMVFQALTCQLDDRFSLCEVASENCFKEGEFLYQSFFQQFPGHIKGFIDLFFMHEDRYYLLDWKSNWIGPDKSYYTQEHLNRVMNEKGYFLQARLYKEAVKKYLKVVDGRPFEKIFGGCFYVFLRGGVFKCPESL